MSDPRELTDEQLTKKINDTYARMNYFLRMGNSNAYQQAVNIYNTLIEENKRRAEEALKNLGGDLDDLIDIKKR